MPPPNASRRKSRDRLPAGPRWASYRETAAYIGVNERTVRQMVDDGRLKQYSLGKRLVRFDLNEVDAAMRSDA
jgi:excisionase family DNA binding protein